MKRCPACNRTYTDDTLRFCLEDGTPLTQDQSDAATLVMPSAPPATVAYGAQTRPANPVPTQPAWTPGSVTPRKRKLWPWVLGSFVLICIVGVGFIVLVIGLASLNSSSTNSSNSSNSENTNAPRPANTNNANTNANREQKPVLGNVAITKAYMAKDNGSGEAGDETESFTPSEHTVHLMIQLGQPAEGTEVKFDWIAVDASPLKDFSMKKLDYTTKAGENKVHAQLTWPRDWPDGDYKVDVYVNDQLARSISYKIETEP